MIEAIGLRLAKANPAFRMVNAEELAPGLKVYMVDVRGGDDLDDPQIQITLDEDPVRRSERTGEFLVFYSYPDWDGQCYVPVSEFVAYTEDKPVHPGPYDFEYWLPVHP